MKEAEQVLASDEAALKMTKQSIADNSQAMKLQERARKQSLEALANRAVEEAATIASGGWGEKLIEHGKRIVAIRNELEARLGQPPPEKWWQRAAELVANGVASGRASIDTHKTAKELAARLDELRQQGHFVADATVSGIFKGLRESAEALERLSAEDVRLQKIKEAQEVAVTRAREARDKALKAKGVAESAYWGLERLA